jgi:hypothetical protein
MVSVVPEGVPDGDAAEPVTGWLPAAGEKVAPARPLRPVAIEYASIVLILSGFLRLLAIGLALVAPPPESGLDIQPLYVVIEAGFQAASIALGVLIRYGRAWLMAANFAAVFAFLQLISLLGVVAIVFGVLFAIAFVAIFANRPWFLATTSWRQATRAERRA